MIGSHPLVYSWYDLHLTRPILLHLGLGGSKLQLQTVSAGTVGRLYSEYLVITRGRPARTRHFYKPEVAGTAHSPPDTAILGRLTAIAAVGTVATVSWGQEWPQKSKRRSVSHWHPVKVERP